MFLLTITKNLNLKFVLQLNLLLYIYLYCYKWTFSLIFKGPNSPFRQKPTYYLLLFAKLNTYFFIYANKCQVLIPLPLLTILHTFFGTENLSKMNKDLHLSSKLFGVIYHKIHYRQLSWSTNIIISTSNQ